MVKSDARPRLILFGIDGATFDVIEPAVAEGKLPTLGRLMQQGSRRVLKSTIPPVTAAAWTTIMTGVNPGKHGLFEFYTLQENSYNTRLVTSRDRQTPAIWDLLSQAGLSVGVLNVPITYPAEAVKGWMISGMMGAPEFNEAACFPAHLAQEVHGLVDYYPMARLLKPARGYYDFAALQQQIASRRLVTLELLRKHPVDVLIVVCSYTDHIQHQFWKNRSLTTRQGEHIEDMVLYAYQEADRFLGELLDFCGEQTTTFIVSDHGAGPVEEFLSIDRFLVDNGLLALKPSAGNFYHRFRTLLARLKSLIPPWLRRRLPTSWSQQARSFLRRQKLSGIDWPHTRAFNIGSYLGLRLNVRGREPQGSIAPEDYYDQRQEIRALLEDYRHPDTGVSLFEVHFPEELYQGPHVSKAPDLLGVIGEEDRIRLTEFVNPASGPVFIDWEEMNRMNPYHLSGCHRMAGVLITAGPHLRAQVLDTEAQLVDIVPTMLYALGLHIPEYCDGQVLTDMFTSDYANRHLPRYTDVNMQRELAGKETSVYSEQESEQLVERLRGLGYLD